MISNIDDLNGNETHVLVSNLRKTLLIMSKFEDDLILKISNPMMILSMDIKHINISMLCKRVGVSRKKCLQCNGSLKFN